jgi:hypothetical protein
MEDESIGCGEGVKAFSVKILKEKLPERKNLANKVF